MRFLALMADGMGNMSGSLTVGFQAVGSMFRLGVIGENLPSVCPASMIQASDGTLLVATGLGPMQRMRYNEKNLSSAGVPAPTTGITILPSTDYENEIQGIPDPLGTGKTLLVQSFDFSQYGPVCRSEGFVVGGGGGNVTTFYSGPFTPDGRRSYNARLALWGSIWRRVAATLQTDLTSNNIVIFSGAPSRVYHQLFDAVPVTGNLNSAARVWKNMVGSFYIYEEEEALPTGQYQCFQRWVDKDGKVSDPGPLSSIVQITDRNIIKYQDVQAPTDPRVVKRQIWRNTSGQVQNFYLDVETDDLSTTEFVSNNSDNQLVLKDLITFTDVDGYTIPYLYAQPPDDKPFIAELRSRIFAVGSRRYYEGSVQVENGSDLVTGIGTSWTASLIGRRFICGTLEYLIKNVDPDTQEITLASSYAGETDNFALYVIAPYAAEELVVRWSDPVAGPEAWPLTGQMLLPQDGDVITGIVNYGDALYITKTRNIYRLNFTEDPAIDGEVSPAARRGCINHRCAVTVEGACLMLDREGIHAFIGGPNPQHISLPVGDLFREDTDGLRINWQADVCMFHAAHYQELSTVKWFVPLAGDLFPWHAICYDYRRSRFWVESYPRPITSSCYSLAITGRPLLGTTEGKILAADTGSLDLVSPGGTLFTVAAVNSQWSIELDAVPKPCTGVPFVIVTGAAAGYDRIISYQDDEEIQFLSPVPVKISVGDKIQIGGIPFRMRTAEFAADRMDGNNPKSFSMEFDPNNENLFGTLSIFRNGIRRASQVAAARSPWGATARNHLANSKHVSLNLGSSLGLVVENLSITTERDLPALLQYQFQIDGSSGEDKPRILEIKVDGAG